MNDEEDEQFDQQSQASKETITSLDPVPIEEDPVTEPPETDQQSIRNRRSNSPTGDEVEPEVKRARYAGGGSSDSNLDLPNLIKQLMPGIESWLHSHITEFIPGAPNPSKPPRPKMTPSEALDRLQKLEAEVNKLKANLNGTNESTEDLVLDFTGCQSRIQKLEAEVKKLKEGSGDLKADLVDYKLKDKVEYTAESEITTDDSSCSTGGRIRRIPSVDAEMLSAMLLRRIKSGPGSTSGHQPPAGDGLSASKKGKKKDTMIKSDGSQVETKDVTTSHDELKMDDNTSLYEMMEDITSEFDLKDVIIYQDEMKDDNASQDEKMDDNTSQDVMKDDNAPVSPVDETKDDSTS